MTGSKSRNTGSWFAIACGTLAGSISSGLFVWSYLVLRDENDQIRALWLFAFALLWMIVAAIVAAAGIVAYDPRASVGRHVSPYGVAKYSSGPGTPGTESERAHEAQGVNQVD